MPNKDKEIGECLRLRNIDGKYFVSYKIDKFDDEGNWLYSDNTEKEVVDLKTTLKQFNDSGLTEMLTLNKNRKQYKINDFDVYYDNVIGLGNFLEIEKLVPDGTNIIELKKEMLEFSKTFNFKIIEPLKCGKPELLIKKNNIDVK